MFIGIFPRPEGRVKRALSCTRPAGVEGELGCIVELAERAYLWVDSWARAESVPMSLVFFPLDPILLSFFFGPWSVMGVFFVVGMNLVSGKVIQANGVVSVNHVTDK